MARFPAHLRHAGAKANTRTGLHVHVGAADFTPDNIKNLVRTFYKQEELILKAAGTEAARISRHTRKSAALFRRTLSPTQTKGASVMGWRLLARITSVEYPPRP